MEIMKGFAGFETVRTGIEAISLTKHFERFSFAVLGIKDTYAGASLGPVLAEKRGDILWIFLTSMGLCTAMLILPLKPDILTKE